MLIPDSVQKILGYVHRSYLLRGDGEAGTDEFSSRRGLSLSIKPRGDVALRVGEMPSSRMRTTEPVVPLLPVASVLPSFALTQISTVIEGDPLRRVNSAVLWASIR